MPVLSTAELHKLKRWNTPSIANAPEQASRADPLTLFNLEETRDFMPEMGPMVGYAMTVVISGRRRCPLRTGARGQRRIPRGLPQRQDAQGPDAGDESGGEVSWRDRDGGCGVSRCMTSELARGQYTGHPTDTHLTYA